MEKLTKIVVNCETGEEIVQELTPSEIADMQAIQADYEARVAARKAEDEALAKAKASALAKLTALGLTEDEARALSN